MTHRLRGVLWVALALTMPSAPAAADGAVTAPGLLSDADFYRLVSCAAPPGGACATAPIRWDTERAIRVALRRIDPGFLGRRKPRAEAAFARALDALKSAGANVRLARVGAADPAEILVYFLDLAPGDAIAGTGIDWVDGAAIDEVATLIAVEPGKPRIHAAVVVVASSLETAAFEGAMLKGLTRAMGLTTEIAGPAYKETSALAQGSFAAKTLGAQDRAALRQHYRADQ